MPADTARWLLNFTSANPTAPDGDGRPWGDGTMMAARARETPTPAPPWDAGCVVTTHIGGYAAMRAMRQSLEAAIAWANGSGAARGQRGHVYLTDWRLNALRNISDSGLPWQPTQPNDPTAIGMLLQLMQAGVKIRVLVWYPVVAAVANGLGPHISDHYWIASIIAAENTRLMKQFGLSDPLGVVGLDMRVTELTVPTATHHQKSMVIRVGPVNVAYCGGVDLAFTRRDAPDQNHTFDPAHPSFMGGDYQSSQGAPSPTRTWPRQAGVFYDSVDSTKVPKDGKQGSDLPENVYGTGWHVWHDQHLELRGPIVSSIESQFCERWIDTGDPWDLNRWKGIGGSHWRNGQVIFSTGEAYDANLNITRPDIAPSVTDTAGASDVQLWRTIPLRGARVNPPFKRGEYTVMAGIAHACKAATQLIWIFDQYFWSRPLARLLNAQIKQQPDLCVIVILPPHADDKFAQAHHARQLAFADLIDGLALGSGLDRVGMYDLWYPARSQGIYCHSKVQMYDGSLLVCGSANLNRRSFMCDSEIACAVLDAALVADHQRRLWGLLFPDPSTPWPAIDLDQPGSGKAFLAKFIAASRNPAACVIPDPWQSSNPQLPTVPPTPRDQNPTAGTYSIFYNHLQDPSSVNTRIEHDSRDATTGALHPSRLDEIVFRLENFVRTYPDGTSDWPYRKT